MNRETMTSALELGQRVAQGAWGPRGGAHNPHSGQDSHQTLNQAPSWNLILNIARVDDTQLVCLICLDLKKYLEIQKLL